MLSAGDCGSKDEGCTKKHWTLRDGRIEDKAKSYPSQLSGGQNSE